jgi:hypothetical protein
MTGEKTKIDLDGYVLFDILYHKDLIPWIVKAMSYRTIYRYSFFGILIFTGTVILLWFFLTSSWNMELLVRIGFLISGLFLFLFLIPLHEYIHVLAYRYCGAENVRVKANWKYFYFYAWAKGFVADSRSIKVIALSPFIIINTLLAILVILLPDMHKAMLFGMMLMHISGSYGDFALLNYFEKFRDKGLISYDDEVVSYFYIKDD